MDKFKKTIGIYILYFESDDAMYYIGKSLDILHRYDIHCRDLRNKCHHNYKLQKLYTKYGSYPTLHILEDIVDLNILSEREVYWINEFDSFNSGINLTGGGDGAGYGHTSPSAIYNKEIYYDILCYLTIKSLSIPDISKLLNVSESIVASIALGISHINLQLEYPEIYAEALAGHGDYSSLRKHDTNVYTNILKDLANTNDKYNVIASRYNVNDGVVEDIGRGATHKYLKDSHPELYALMISKKGNRRTGSQSGKVYPAVLSPTGEIHESISNAKKFALDNSLHQGHFGELLRGTVKSHKGWTLAPVSS